MSLSDSFCVERHRAELRRFVAEHVDVLFANEAEIVSLYETDDFDAAAAAVRAEVELAALTRGGTGSTIVSRDETVRVEARPIDRVVDTTGAGDLYASGFLFGLASGLDLAESARLGSLAAAEVISQVGARPRTRLRELLQ
jgi:sugar/nucleoside kinase (ribokinase family)